MLVKKKAFTLAETLITLSVLGIVAAITLPALINKQIESANRTKVRKAMSAYEKIINLILIDNDLQTENAFRVWAKNDAKENSYKEQKDYFKITEESEYFPNCRFKTGDKVWWDICGINDSNIENPIIILNEKYIEESRANLEVMAKNFEDDNKKRLYVYALVGRRDLTTGIVRVNDKIYENSQKEGNYPEYMEKLYAFLEKRDMSTNTLENEISAILKSTPEQLSECTSWPCIISYNCSVTEDDSTTICTVKYITKEVISDEEASEAITEKTFLCDWDGQKCEKKTSSIIESGNIFVSEQLTLNEDDAKSPENCAASRNKTYCEKQGDYWTLARRKCEEQGGHLPSAAELKALYNKQDGTLDNSSTYWAAESNSNNNKMGYVLNTNDGGVYSTKYNITVSDKNHKAICVSN